MLENGSPRKTKWHTIAPNMQATSSTTPMLLTKGMRSSNAPAISSPPAKYRNQSPNPIFAKIRIHSSAGPMENFSRPVDTDKHTTGSRIAQWVNFKRAPVGFAVSLYAVIANPKIRRDA
jgi:hypothetical protein